MAAIRGGRRNGVRVRPADVRFPGDGFAPARVTVRVRGVARRVNGDHHGSIRVRASATAELSPAPGSSVPASASGGGYDGPLAYRQGKPMRPDVAIAFDRMATAQAVLFAAHRDPKWVAPPGESLHRYATELDLGPPGAYAWLAANATRFGFLRRYGWE